MDKRKKLTLEELVAKKEQRNQDKLIFKDVFIPSLGGCLTLKKLPVSRFVSLTGRYDASDFEQAIDYQIALAYASCPMFQNKELQEAYEVGEPSEIVMAVLADDLGALSQLTDAITGFYGLGEAEEEVKN